MPKQLNKKDRMELRMQGKSFDDGTRIMQDEDTNEEQDAVTKSVIELAKHAAAMTKALTEMQRTVSAAVESMSSTLAIQTDSIKAIAQAMQKSKELPKSDKRYVFDVRRDDGKTKYQIIATTKEDK